MTANKERSIRGTTANKGEWAELYVFLRLLGEGRLYAADAHLNKKSDSYLDILRIFREEVPGKVLSYSLEGEPGTIEVYAGEGLIASIPCQELFVNAVDFFEYLTVAKPPIGPTERLADLCDRLSIAKSKAAANKSIRALISSGGKTDIVIRLRDSRNSLVSTMGFSIKSQFAAPPTLFNAGTSAQMNYSMHGMTDELAIEFNALVDEKGNRKWAACKELIKESGVEPEFIGSKYPTLGDNLEYIRESMPALWAFAVEKAILDYDSCANISDICELAKQDNPLHYKHTDLYEKVFKDFLFAAFSGMTAGRQWDGLEQVNGGYIVVKPDGEVLCYYANDREAFRDYLFKTTHLEYVSCGKYKWGFVDQDDDGNWILPAMASVRFGKI